MRVHDLIFLALGLMASTGCVEHVSQVGGTGSVYATRCSAVMDAVGDTYTARCTPLSCTEGYTDVGVSHVVVALDPGRKVVGLAERTCVQDLSDTARVFDPTVVQPEAPTEP